MAVSMLGLPIKFDLPGLKGNTPIHANVGGLPINDPTDPTKAAEDMASLLADLVRDTQQRAGKEKFFPRL
jgi:hypothetical protein